MTIKCSIQVSIPMLRPFWAESFEVPSKIGPKFPLFFGGRGGNGIKI